jgi:hypothetical protein
LAIRGLPLVAIKTARRAPNYAESGRLVALTKLLIARSICDRPGRESA